MLIFSAAIVAAFVLIHVFIGELRFLDGVPRSRWLSLAGGVAVAYVFLHVLPELNVHQATVRDQTAVGRSGILESEIYFVALTGLAAFYGLERFVRGSRAAVRERGTEDKPAGDAFWLGC